MLSVCKKLQFLNIFYKKVLTILAPILKAIIPIIIPSNININITTLVILSPIKIILYMEEIKMLQRKLYMTIPEFNAIQRGELTYKEIKKSQSLIINNPRLKKVIVLAMACSLIVEKTVLAEPNIQVISNAGQTLLSTAQVIGYWACLVMCIVEIIMAMLSHQSNKLKEICIKYVIAFASLYFMPWVFDLIRDLFGGL